MTKRVGGGEWCVFAVSVILWLASAEVSAFATSSNICDSTHGICVQTWQQDTNVPGVGSGFSYRTGENLSEIEITTLAEGVNANGMTNEKANAPVQICPGICSQVGNAFSFNHIQRPGLLYVPANFGNGLTNDHVYVAFSMIDGAGVPFPAGMVFGFDATNVTSMIGPFQTSGGVRKSDGGGIWMGGAGLAFGPDGTGTGAKNWIYMTTANGTFDGGTNWGDSFIKLDPSTLTIPSTSNSTYYFTPSDEQWRGDDINCNPPNGNDVDFGSGGVVLIPDNELAYPGYGYVAVSGDKEGYLWFMERNAPGAFNGVSTGCITGIGTNHNVQAYPVGSNVIHNNVAFWESDSVSLPRVPYVYVTPTNQAHIYQYTVCATSSDVNPICGSTYSAKASIAAGPNGEYPSGLTPTISSASSTDPQAILWAIDKPDGGIAQGENVSGILYAFDAVTMRQIYSSNNSCGADNIVPPATKFSVPTVANGYVYLGTQDVDGTYPNETNNGKGRFYIFGGGRTGC